MHQISCCRNLPMVLPMAAGRNSSNRRPYVLLKKSGLIKSWKVDLGDDEHRTVTKHRYIYSYIQVYCANVLHTDV